MEDNEYIEGLAAFGKMLEKIGDEKLVNNLLRKTNKEVLKPVRSGYKGLSFAKRLLKKIGIRSAKVEGSSHPNAAIVGPTTDAFPLRFLNTGTVERYTKSGAYRGKITGTHQIGPFLDTESKSLFDRVKTGYGEDFEGILKKEVKKVNKRK